MTTDQEEKCYRREEVKRRGAGVGEGEEEKWAWCPNESMAEKKVRWVSIFKSKHFHYVGMKDVLFVFFLSMCTCPCVYQHHLYLRLDASFARLCLHGSELACVTVYIFMLIPSAASLLS